MSTAQVPTLDMNKLNVFIGQFVTDLGAAVHAGMVVIGEKLGLYKALASGPMSPAQLAAKTKTDERYLREWLASQAAGGYVTYDEKNDKFSLSEEQAFTLATEDSPAYLPGAFELALGSLAAVPRIAESFRTMIPCGSFCMVAATATTGWPSEMASRIPSDEAMPNCALPDATCCSTLTYGPPG